MPDEVRGRPAGGEELAEGDADGPGAGFVSIHLVGGEESTGSALEPGHLGQQTEERGVGEVAGLGEHTAESVATRVLETAAGAGHRHRHVARLGLDPELREESDEVRIGLPVVHDEPAVDGHDPVVGRHDVVGVGVAAEAVVALEEGHVVVALQEVRGGEPGDPGTDDCCNRPRARGAHATSDRVDSTPSTSTSTSAIGAPAATARTKRAVR